MYYNSSIFNETDFTVTITLYNLCVVRIVMKQTLCTSYYIYAYSGVPNNHVCMWEDFSEIDKRVGPNKGV